MTVTGIDMVLQRMSELANAMVAIQNEVRSVKWDLGEIKATNSTPNINNCLTNIHVFQQENLTMPQQPLVSYTNQIRNNPPSQASGEQRLVGPNEAVSCCKVVVNGSKSNKT